MDFMLTNLFANISYVYTFVGTIQRQPHYVDDSKMCVCTVSSTYKLVRCRSYTPYTSSYMCSFLFRIRGGCLLFYRLRLNDDYTEITLYPCSQVKTAQMNIILHMRKRNVERLHQSHCLVPHV